MRKIIASGNLVADATIFTPQNGNRSSINFTLCVNEKFKNSEGVETKKTFFMSCSYWKDKKSTKIVDYLKKGTHLVVVGLADVHSYVNKDGVTVAQQKIEVKEIELTHSVKKEDNTTTSNDDDNGDLPF